MKIDREKVFKKYNGHCAYCGCEIDKDNFAIDHINPLYRNDSDDKLKELNITRGTDNYNNLNPSCKSCNRYKGTLSIEKFRERIKQYIKMLDRDNPLFRLLKRYNIVILDNKDVVFYFERFKK